jgi:hypothetical protein
VEIVRISYDRNSVTNDDVNLEINSYLNKTAKGIWPTRSYPFCISASRKQPSPSHDCNSYDSTGTFFGRVCGNCPNFLRPQFGDELRHQFGNQQLVHPATIKNYSGLNGYKNIATDLQIQGQILKDHWRQIEGKSAATQAEIEQAFKVAAHLLRLTGEKEQSPAVVASTADMRKRAFTLFTRAYDDARRVMLFLRWHEEDADTIIPSLYAGRGGTKKKPTGDETVQAPSVSSVQTTNPVTTAPPAAAQTASSNGANPSPAKTNNQPFMT